MNKLLVVLTIAALSFASLDTLAKGSFGGSRSSSSVSRSSSFGGSRSSSRPSSGSSFGGSRSRAAAPIVRRPSNPSTSSGTVVQHNYYGGGGGGYGYGGYYGSPYYGGGFFHGFMWGQFFNRPQVIYVNGNSYIQGQNGQPLLDAQGQPVEYSSNPLLSVLAFFVWLLIIGGVFYVGLLAYRSYNA